MVQLGELFGPIIQSNYGPIILRGLSVISNLKHQFLMTEFTLCLTSSRVRHVGPVNVHTLAGTYQHFLP